ncbi:MAG: hypothetical protein NTX23_09045 [Candidatus Bipolaricaulota bacterium]|nr:hypothetical protein [Candidatus Bipolaricaulota bacterium]
MNKRIKRWGKITGVGSLCALSVLILAAGAAWAEAPCVKLPDLWFPEPGVVLSDGTISVQETSGGVCEGGTVTITVTIDNLSCGAAGAFDVSVSWDESHLIATKHVTGLPGCDFVTLTFTWDTEGIPPGEHTILVVADSGSVIHELNEGNDRETFDVLVRPNEPMVEVTKSYVDLDGPPVDPGDTVRYEIEITNVGCADLKNVAGHEYIDTLPAVLTPTGSVQAESGSIVIDGNTIFWDGAIPSGGTVHLTYKARIAADALPDSEICNQGFAHWDSGNDGAQDASEPSDDPSTPADDDPTCFTLQKPAEPMPLTGTIDAPSLTEWGMIGLSVAFVLAFTWRLWTRRTRAVKGRA